MRAYNHDKSRVLPFGAPGRMSNPTSEAKAEQSEFGCQPLRRTLITDYVGFMNQEDKIYNI